MKKINIAEILKDCPRGIKLYTTVWGDVEFIKLGNVGTITILPISNLYNTSDTKILYSDGKYALDGECILFPSKENRDWSNFHKPFENGDKIHLWTIQDAKDGDVISYDDGWTCIFKRIHGIWYSSYCFITNDGDFHTGYEEHAVDSKINGNAHLATNEQCGLLFQKIKEAGYKWNPETKTLEELITPKFEVGDRIKPIGSDKHYIIKNIKFDRYILTNNYFLKFTDEHMFELIPKKFDIDVDK